MQSEIEKRKESCLKVGDTSASEIISYQAKMINMLGRSFACITALAIVTVVGLLILLNVQNSRFIDYLSQYDFVSQDGEGYNYYNSEIKGDVSNGTENQKIKEQEPETRSGD